MEMSSCKIMRLKSCLCGKQYILAWLQDQRSVDTQPVLHWEVGEKGDVKKKKQKSPPHTHLPRAFTARDGPQGAGSMT